MGATGEAKATPNRVWNTRLFLVRFSGNAQRSLRTDRHFAYAPQQVVDTDNWGVSDPARRGWGDVGDPRAGSLTPLPCCDTCAGALTGRHKPPPSWLGPTSINIGSVSDCSASITAVALESRASREIGATKEGGHRALALRPPPRPPFVGVCTTVGRRW
jgi:hypothetical protein